MNFEKYRIPSEFELIDRFKYEEWNGTLKKWIKKKWEDSHSLFKKYPFYGVKTVLKIYEDDWYRFARLAKQNRIRVYIDKSDYFYEIRRFYALWSLSIQDKFVSHNTLITQKLNHREYDEAHKYVKHLLYKYKHLIHGDYLDEFIELYLDYVLKNYYVKIGVYSRINLHDHTVYGGPYISTEKPWKTQNLSFTKKVDENFNINKSLEMKSMKSNNKRKKTQQQNELLSRLQHINKTHLIKNGTQDLPLKKYIVCYFDKEAGTNHSMEITARTLKRVFNKLKWQYKIHPNLVKWIRSEKEPSIDLYFKKTDNSKKEKFVVTPKNLTYGYYTVPDKKVCIKRQLEDKSWEIKRVWKSEIGKIYSTHEWSYCAKKKYKALGKPLKQIKTIKVDLYKTSASSYEYTNEEWSSLKKLYSELSNLRSEVKFHKKFNINDFKRTYTVKNFEQINEIEKKINKIKYQIKSRRLKNKIGYKNKIIKVSQKTIHLFQKEYINFPKPNYNHLYKKKHKSDLWKKRNKTWRGKIKYKNINKNKSLKQKHIQNNYKLYKNVEAI